MAALTVFATAPPASAESVGQTIRFSGGCSMDVWAYLMHIRADFDFTAVGTVQSDGRVKVTHTDYAFSRARAYYLGEVYQGDVERGNSSNVDVTSPVSRISPDSMAPTGTYNHSDFTISSGTNISVRGRLDLKDTPDPSCTATTSAAWTVTK